MISSFQNLESRLLSHNSVLRQCFNFRKSGMATLESLHFDNLALRRLPIDMEERNYVRTVSGACFSKVKPTPVVNPELIVYSTDAMSLLDLKEDELNRKEFVKYFSGNQLLPGSETAAHCYCGHQFGYFSGQLGDGAAMYLGEVINAKNERWEIQLKGAGLTPYSRSADGRKVMRSSIREFLCSEAMHFLGIPTTRAGSCITSSSEVIRDVFYSGHPIKEKCTIVLRIAPTFLRFGSFEIFKTMDPSTMRTGPSLGRTDILKQMLDYAIETFYPEIHSVAHENDEAKYAAFFKEVVLRTARMVAKWQCVGFCHGVLNTDNMSILGLTIDYGPFGFMDMYNPDFICNASDDNGRYSYMRQPEVCLWNLKKLAEALQKVLPLSVSTPLLDFYDIEFDECYLNEMRQKLGLQRQLPDDENLVEKLFDTMEKTGADFTNTFRCLSLLELPKLQSHSRSLVLLKEKLLEQCYPIPHVVKSMEDGLDMRNLQMLFALTRTNPEFEERLNSSGITLERVIKKMRRAEVLQDFPIQTFQDMAPQTRKDEVSEAWNDWLNLYVQRLNDETLGYEFEELPALQKEKTRIMNGINPRFILRNYIAQDAITKAEARDYSEVRKVLKSLENPYDDDDVQLDDINQGASTSSASTIDEASFESGVISHGPRLQKLPPNWAFRLKVT